MYLVNKICLSNAIVDTVPELCQKVDFFLNKKGEKHFCLCYGINILDEMQNISTLMCESLKCEGNAF